MSANAVSHHLGVFAPIIRASMHTSGHIGLAIANPSANLDTGLLTGYDAGGGSQGLTPKTSPNAVPAQGMSTPYMISLSQLLLIL